MNTEYKRWLRNKEYRERPEVRERNIERKKLLRDIKCNCACGGKYSLPHKTKHENTNKHIRWVACLKNEEVAEVAEVE